MASHGFVRGAAPATAALIAAKCRVPPVAERLVARPRLERLIAEKVARHRPVFVSATAGAGKTTAVAQSLGATGLPVAWLTLDATDAAPGRLLTYLEAALASAVPAVAGVVGSALRRRVPHREAAGLLAEATTGAPVLLVVDEMERIVGAPEALAVLAALVRYAPPSLRLVFVSRQEVALDLPTDAAIGGAAALGEVDLAFTTSEAEAALATMGSGGIDAASAVEATGGWVAGVLFEAWRSDDHVAGLGGEADPLHGYLASQVFEQLEPREQELLVGTALLPEVTAERAEALGFAEAAATLSSLRAKHLPVTWDKGAYAMRCHTRFREYLLVLLERRPRREVTAFQRGWGEILERDGHPEDAVEAYLEAGALESALRAAEGALETIVERLDFAVAERLLAALRPIASPGDGELTRAELMLAIGRERYAEGAAVADRLAEEGELKVLAARSTRAASMIAWCLWHSGRVAETRELIALAGDSQEATAVHYLLSLVDSRPRRSLDPVETGGPLDALIMRVGYQHGRLLDVAEPPPSQWAAGVSAPWRIGALRALGRLDEALALYEGGGFEDWAPVWFHAMVEPELMIDLGRTEDARAALAHARSLVRRSGSVVYDMLNRLIEAKLELRLSRDHERADALLLALAARPEATAYAFVEEQIATWAGMVLLLRNEHVGALRRLRRAVRSMQATDRILELPTAAVLLAEAEWRAGNEEASDAAADAALEAASRQGSNHILLQALADFPAVASRRMDADADADSSWHELARALAAQDGSIAIAARSAVVLDEFGGPALYVGEQRVYPRIKKSYELLAFLLSQRGGRVSRERLLHALFGRADESAQSYLRQAAHQLRGVLPDGVEVVLERDHAHLVRPELVQSEFARAEETLARSAHAPLADRGVLIEQALAIVDRGPYLGSIESAWVEERRDRLARRLADARHEAAKAAYAAGQFHDARRQAERVLQHDPYRESTWRLLMRVASALGDEAAVIDAYRRCEKAIVELGARPAATTQALLRSLRK